MSVKLLTKKVVLHLLFSRTLLSYNIIIITYTYKLRIWHCSYTRSAWFQYNACSVLCIVYTMYTQGVCWKLNAARRIVVNRGGAMMIYVVVIDYRVTFGHRYEILRVSCNASTYRYGRYRCTRIIIFLWRRDTRGPIILERHSIRNRRSTLIIVHRYILYINVILLNDDQTQTVVWILTNFRFCGLAENNRVILISRYVIGY